MVGLRTLTEGFVGGDTQFPKLKPEPVSAGSAAGGRMRAGDGLLFYSLLADGTINKAAQHQGMPTAATEEGDDGDGERPQKVICNFWYREKRWWGYTHF